MGATQPFGARLHHTITRTVPLKGSMTVSTRVDTINVYVLRNRYGAVQIPDQAGMRELTISSVLVEVNTNDGLTGYGESFCRHLEETKALGHVLEALSHKLIGKNPIDVHQRWHELYVDAKRTGGYGALSALDEAMWDIRGKAAGRPVYELLGGLTTPVKPYATFPIHRSVEQLVEDASWLKEHGFSKMKITVGSDLEADKANIEYLSEHFPRGFRFGIDANTTYGYNDAFHIGQVASECGCMWFEEPVDHFNVRAMAELNSRLSVPIAGFQTHNTHYAALPLLEASALDIYQPSLDYIGGITAAQRLAVLVEAFGKSLVPHTMGPVVNFVASLHLAAADRNCTLIEFPVLSRDLSNPGRFHAGAYMANIEDVDVRPDGTILPPNRPGLGVEIDWDVIEEVQVSKLTISS